LIGSFTKLKNLFCSDRKPAANHPQTSYHLTRASFQFHATEHTNTKV